MVNINFLRNHNLKQFSNNKNTINKKNIDNDISIIKTKKIMKSFNNNKSLTIKPSFIENYYTKNILKIKIKNFNDLNIVYNIVKYYENKLINLNIDEINNYSFSTKTYCGKTIPTISLIDFLKRILKKYDIIDNSSIKNLICATIYIEKLFKKLNNFQFCRRNIHRLFIITFILASKMNDDECPTNREFSKFIGISLTEINILEERLLNDLNFNFHINYNEYQSIYNKFI